jgi:serine/threonine protein kinase
MSDDQRHPVELLADDFAARLRSGESVSVSEYTDRHPEIADLIRSVFAPIKVIEKARCQRDSARSDSPIPRPDPLRESIPGLLGDFEIVREIGRGGMGVVYEARQRSLKRPVALKVISGLSSASEARRERFRREAEAAAGLHHTNIVAVFGTGEDQGFLYYAMQLIHGMPLGELIRRLRHIGNPAAEDCESEKADVAATNDEGTSAGGAAHDSDQIPAIIRNCVFNRDRTSIRSNPEAKGTARSRPDHDTVNDLATSKPEDSTRAALPTHPKYFRCAAELIANVAGGLDYAHRAGVLHRDIKPSNLILDHDGTLWITDFGVAKRAELEDMTQSGEIVGTLRYMAPEQLCGTSDARSDIYSLGLTLYELLTWQPAIQASTGKWFEATSRGIIPKPRQTNPKIPSDLELILLKACASDPVDRYGTAADFENDLRRFLEDRPILARRDSSFKKLRRVVRRNPTVTLLATASLGLLILVAAVLAVGNHQKQQVLGELRVAYGEAGRNLRQRTEALAIADRERDRAETNLQLALEAFESVIDNIGSRGGVEALLDDLGDDESVMAADAVLSDADLKLLEGLLRFFDRFATENGTDLSAEAAVAQRRVGDIYQRLGRLEEADRAYRDALQTYQELRQIQPRNVALVLAEMEVMNERMTVASGLGRAGEVVSAYKSARSLIEQTPAIANSNEGKFALAKLSSTLASLGSRFGRQNRPRFEAGRFDALLNRRGAMRNAWESGGGSIPQAKLDREQEANSTALRLLNELLNDEPQNIAFQTALARAQREEVRLAQTVRDRPRAEQALEQSVALFQQLSDRFPESLAFKYELAQTLRGGLQLGGTDSRNFQLAIKVCDELVRANPDSVDYRAIRSSTLTRVAATMFANGKQEPALEMLKKAIEDQKYLVTREPNVVIYRIAVMQSLGNLADALVNLDREAEAAIALDQAIEMLNGSRVKIRNPAILQRLQTRRDALRAAN